MNNNNIHYKWLATMLLLVAAMVAPTSVWAQTMYTVFDTETSTLTFKYDNNRPTESTETQNVYDVPDRSITPDWSKNHSGEIKTVVFDKSFADARPTTCYCWFYEFRLLTDIQGIQYLNTSEVTNMFNMFRNCSKLTYLDLTGFDTKNVTNMECMFCNCENLVSIYVSESFTTNNVTNSDYMFGYCYSLVGAVAYSEDSEDKKNATMANTSTGYFKEPGDCSAYVVFNSVDNSLTFKYDTNISQVAENETVCTIKTCNQSPGWYNNRSSITKVVFEPSFISARPAACYYWFSYCTNLATIEGLEYLNTSEVTSMSFMFSGCKKITTLNLSNFDTSKVTDMIHMFYHCDALTTIYVSDKFVVDQVTNDNMMFAYSEALKGAQKYSNLKYDKTYANYRTGYFTCGINTADDLKAFAQSVNGTYTPADGETATAYPAACAGLMKDIALTADDIMEPMGKNGSYTGTFDGLGHTISGLNFSSNKSLFATNGGTIKNLGVVAQGSEGYICQTNSGTIDHCFYMGTTAEETTSPSGTVCQTNDGTVANCYYLADSETDAIEGTTYKTASQFKSGEVCYLLNNGTTDGTQTWYQNLSEENGDKWPVVTGTGENTVYQVNLLCGGVSNIGKTYANTNEDVVKAHYLPETATFDSGKNIYKNVCKSEGCGKTLYFADEESTIEATPNADLTYFTVADYPLSDATAYTSLARFSADKLSYTRKFSDNKWMAVYVPFHINCDKLEKEYEMAVINNFHEYEQEDGTYKVVLEVKRVTKGGTIPALTPCLIRMKTAPEAETYKTLTFTDVQFVPAAEKSTRCFSVTRNYEFFGTLNGKDGFNEYTDYVLSKGILYRAGYNTRLLPQRWYLTATTRDGNSSAYAKLRSITINDSGDGQATGIDDIHVNTESCTDASPAIYDLQGRRLTQEPQKGVYIKNGVKQVK